MGDPTLPVLRPVARPSPAARLARGRAAVKPGPAAPGGGAQPSSSRRAGRPSLVRVGGAARWQDSPIDYDAVIDALGGLAGQDVLVAVQFSDASLDPIALISGRLSRQAAHRHRFSVGDAVIVVRPEDVVDGRWIEGRGEEPALRIDLRDVQVTVGPASRDMADPLDG